MLPDLARMEARAALLVVALAVAGCGPVPRATSATLEACLDRPANGYATPALKRRIQRCRALLMRGWPPPQAAPMPVAAEPADPLARPHAQADARGATHRSSHS